MKLKYIIRNMFFPRHHSPLVREIAILQKQMVVLVKEREKYVRMMERGFLGDPLWGSYHGICREIRRIEKEIAHRKSTLYKEIKEE